jgi:peroxiredoxin
MTRSVSRSVARALKPAGFSPPARPRRALSRALPRAALLLASLLPACLLLTGLGALACGTAREPAGAAPELTGDWRAVLGSPGGELPFTLRLRQEEGQLTASAVNGSEEAPFSQVSVDGNQVTLAIGWYDSVIEAHLENGGRRLRGTWRKTVPEGVSTLPFEAVKDDRGRFMQEAEVPTADGLPAAQDGAAGAPETVAGSWAATFTDEDGSEPALGELEQDGRRVTGTFLTPTGDYRFLEGEYRGGRLRLSCFDGAHAFLFHATAQPDGSLAGDFWSRDSYHATWTARRLDAGGGGEVLPNPFELVRLTNQEQRFDFNLPDLDGRRVSLSDARFRGKVVLVNLFGSWCPNCNDEAPVLGEWYRRYHDRGLEIVGLAFEMTGDPERDGAFVRKFAQRHRLTYPMLLAGTTDKQQAAALLGDLDRVVAYPTTVFIGRDGRVRRIHSGFAGPGTGEHYTELLAELEGLIEDLLAEPRPQTPPSATG